MTWIAECLLKPKVEFVSEEEDWTCHPPDHHLGWTGIKWIIRMDMVIQQPSKLPGMKFKIVPPFAR